VETATVQPANPRSPPRPYTARVDRTEVLVLRETVVVGYGRWTGERIVDLRPPLLPAPPGEDEAARAARLAEEEAILEALSQQLAAEERAAVARLHEEAYDAEGVDRSLIAWILHMPPAERFDVLEGYTAIPYRRILDVLGAHQVEHVVVGGVAAHFYGASYATKDMDLVYARSPENIRRMLAALDEMETIFRDFAGRRIAPNASYLASANPKLLLTRHGPLDLLGTLSMEDDDTGYESLVGDATVVDLGGTTVRVIALARLIAVKERLQRPRDLLVLPLLRAALNHDGAPSGPKPRAGRAGLDHAEAAGGTGARPDEPA
jgi:hypothetical protein